MLLKRVLLKQANSQLPSVACRNDIHHCGEQDDKPDKIDERNEENVVWLAGEPRMMIAHICLLSPRLGLGRQKFRTSQSLSAADTSASTLFTVKGHAIIPERALRLLFALH